MALVFLRIAEQWGFVKVAPGKRRAGRQEEGAPGRQGNGGNSQEEEKAVHVPTAKHPRPPSALD